MSTGTQVSSQFVSHRKLEHCFICMSRIKRPVFIVLYIEPWLNKSFNEEQLFVASTSDPNAETGNGILENAVPATGGCAKLAVDI